MPVASGPTSPTLSERTAVQAWGHRAGFHRVANQRTTRGDFRLAYSGTSPDRPGRAVRPEPDPPNGVANWSFFR
jgi:hypothetical protein